MACADPERGTVGIGEHYLSAIKKKREKKTLSELDPLWQNFLDPSMRGLICIV